jgi:hypothetical protein
MSLYFNPDGTREQVLRSFARPFQGKDSNWTSHPTSDDDIVIVAEIDNLLFRAQLIVLGDSDYNTIFSRTDSRPMSLFEAKVKDLRSRDNQVDDFMRHYFSRNCSK